MRTTTAIQIRSKAKAALECAYLAARDCGLTHGELIAQTHAIKFSANVKRAPAWVSHFLDGYDTAQRDALYSTGALVFGGKLDGAFYSTYRDRPDYYERNGISPGEWADDGKVTERGHYWTTTDAPRPFFLNV